MFDSPFQKAQKIARFISIILFVLFAQFLLSCSSLWSTSGAGVGAGIGAMVSPPVAMAGAVGGSLAGSLIEEEDRTEKVEQMNREVIETLIKASSDEAKAHALDIVADSSESVIDEIKDFLSTIFKWVILVAIGYFLFKVLLNKKQEQALVERVKNLIGEEEEEYEYLESDE
ncbi:MAG: hypothetical protein Unbinned4098contig1000_16 [Prokaryotic dsDNA virus sp.]|nr:MAG: hypothetical protein Unbinned4098contig1000_16 [Prokaryotic dsDNA virus sp.]|tara:strand:- start:529 stop:1044 length:516 start_codon:yes stop_codon:yes gene_type:complete